MYVDEMKLTENVTRSFRVAKIFRENADKITSIDFSSNGETLISSSDDDSIVIYDCQNGTPKRTLNSKKYGVDLIRYTHAVNTALHSSTKVDDTIRYLSLHDNKYIRYFPGHAKKVVCLCMSPVNDSFLSGSLDKTIRLWDLRSQNCQGMMHLPGRPVATFDPEGLIFAAGINSECVKLYDLRSFDRGPFATFKLPQDKECDWTGMKFSPDGRLIVVSTNGQVIRLIDAFQGTPLQTFVPFLPGTSKPDLNWKGLTLNQTMGMKFSQDGRLIVVSTNGQVIRLIDAFQGTPLQTFVGHCNTKGIPLEASFSPDSQFVFCGSTDGRVHCWNTETGVKVATMSCDHPGPVQCVGFNPKYMMLASACTNMAFWLPNMDE